MRARFTARSAMPREAVRSSATARRTKWIMPTDVEEGGDFLSVKPTLSYLDIVREVKNEFILPVVGYNVSGEYAMVKAAAQIGKIEEKALVLEMLTSMKRAGADLIITYFAKDAAKWISE